MLPSELQTIAASTSGNSTRSGDEGAILRDLDIEEATNKYLIHKLSLVLIPVFIRLGVSPNTVSLMGAACGVIAAFCFFRYDHAVVCVLGFAFMIGWHVFDGADGQLARCTGKVSVSGFVIDGTCDYVTFVCVYVALGLRLSQEYGVLVWGLIILAGASHAIQAAAFEIQRDFYNRWTTSFNLTDMVEKAKKTDDMRLGQAWIIRLMAKMYAVLQEPFRPISRSFAYSLTTKEDISSNSSEFSRAYRTEFRKIVLTWSLLSANNRTIAIFLFCIVGTPLYYFIYEVSVLNFTLLALIGLNKSKERDLSGRLGLA